MNPLLQPEFLPSSRRTHKSTLNLFLRVATVCLGTCFAGFCSVFLEAIFGHNGSHFYPNRYLYNVSLGVFPFAAVMGVFPVNRFHLKSYSRRQTFIIAGVFGLLGTLLLCFLSNAYASQDLQSFLRNPILTSGRVLQGISSGIFSVNCLLYITEISPQQLRMSLGAVYQLSIAVGMTLAYLTVYTIFGYNVPTRYHLYIFAIIPTVLLVGQMVLVLFVFKEETPLYLLSKGRNEEARSLISSIYINQYIEDVYTQQEQLHNQALVAPQPHQFDLIVNLQLLKIGVLVTTLQQMSGINYYNFEVSRRYFLQYILPFVFLILGTLGLIVGNFATTKSFHKYLSSRSLLIKWGAMVCYGISTVGFLLYIGGNMDQAIGLVAYFISWLVLNLYMFTYGLTLGPTVYIYLSELCSPKQLDVLIAFGWGLVFLNHTVIPMLWKNDGIEVFTQLVVVVVCVVYFGVGRKWLVETKGKSPMQLGREMAQGEMPRGHVAIEA